MIDKSVKKGVIHKKMLPAENQQSFNFKLTLILIFVSKNVEY